jgi:hypothetical protein
MHNGRRQLLSWPCMARPGTPLELWGSRALDPVFRNRMVPKLRWVFRRAMLHACMLHICVQWRFDAAGTSTAVHNLPLALLLLQYILVQKGPTKDTMCAAVTPLAPHCDTLCQALPTAHSRTLSVHVSHLKAPEQQLPRSYSCCLLHRPDSRVQNMLSTPPWWVNCA